MFEDVGSHELTASFKPSLAVAAAVGRGGDAANGKHAGFSVIRSPSKAYLQEKLAAAYEM